MGHAFSFLIEFGKRQLFLPQLRRFCNREKNDHRQHSQGSTGGRQNIDMACSILPRMYGKEEKPMSAIRLPE
jgi:hypothetical protein